MNFRQYICTQTYTKKEIFHFKEQKKKTKIDHKYKQKKLKICIYEIYDTQQQEIMMTILIKRKTKYEFLYTSDSLYLLYSPI